MADFPIFPSAFIGSPFETEQVDFYSGAINFELLLNTLKTSDSFKFNYENFISRTFESSSYYTGTQSFSQSYLTDNFLRYRNSLGEIVKLKMNGKLNKTVDFVSARIEGKGLFSFIIDVNNKKINYIKRILYENNTELAIELVAFNYNDYVFMSNYGNTTVLSDKAEAL